MRSLAGGIAALGWLALCSTAAVADGARLTLSLYGWQSAWVGCFDEVRSPYTVSLWLPNTMDEQGYYHFGVRSWGHDHYGCPLPPTENDPQCGGGYGGYDLTLWFDPGAVVIGHMTTTDQNCQISGGAWQGHVPSDFNLLCVERIQSHPTCMIDTLRIPIVWYGENPASAPESQPAFELHSWGKIKSTYR